MRVSPVNGEPGVLHFNKYVNSIVPEEGRRSCDGFAFGPGNPPVCGYSPQHRGQQQAEGGHTENQQVHLSTKRRKHGESVFVSTVSY